MIRTILGTLVVVGLLTIAAVAMSSTDRVS
jgi:hypothetical protein